MTCLRLILGALADEDDVEREQAARLESHVDATESQQTLTEERRADHQRERDGDFEGDERLTKPRPRARSGAGRAKVVRGSRSPDHDGWQNSEHQGAAENRCGCRREHAGVERESIRVPDARGRQTGDSAQTEFREENASRAPANRQHDALHQKQTHQPKPACPERHANRQLAPARRQTHDEEIRHVDACQNDDEQARE